MARERKRERERDRERRKRETESVVTGFLCIAIGLYEGFSRVYRVSVVFIGLYPEHSFLGSIKWYCKPARFSKRQQ